MIRPGTLVQYVRNHPLSALRPHGIYTVSGSQAPTGPCCDLFCDGDTEIHLVEEKGWHGWVGDVYVRPESGWCICAFRILAPPITEADRLEMTAPDDGEAKPAPKVKVRS